MSFVKFALLTLIVLGIQSGLTPGAVALGMNKWIVYIPVQLIVYPLSYLLQRAIVFREGRTSLFSIFGNLFYVWLNGR